MSPITVGIIGHNGLVGNKLLEQFSALQAEGKVKVVVLHRPSSATSIIPVDVEKRVIDLTATDGPDFDAAVQGLDVLVSAVSSTANADQAALLPALSRSQTLKTFLPSEYGAPWSEEELSLLTTQFVKDKDAIAEKAKELGVATTLLKVGVISDFVFQFPMAEWNPQANQIQYWRDSQKTAIPFTSSSYIAAAVADLVFRPLDSIANKAFYAVEQYATDRDLAAIFTKLHGKETEWIQVDDAKIHADVTNAHPYVSLGAAIFQKSGRGWWNYDAFEKVEPKGWEAKGLEQDIKKNIGN